MKESFRTRYRLFKCYFIEVLLWSFMVVIKAILIVLILIFLSLKMSSFSKPVSMQRFRSLSSAVCTEL